MCYERFRLSLTGWSLCAGMFGATVAYARLVKNLYDRKRMW